MNASHDDFKHVDLALDELEMLSALVEIQRERQLVCSPRRLRYLADQEKRIELYFNNRPSRQLVSCATLDRLARGTGLHGLLVIEETATEGPLFVDDDCLMIAPATLELLARLLETSAARPWTAGLEYLIDVLKYERRASERKRLVGADPVALAHLQAWNGWEGIPNRNESCARAIMLRAALGQGCLPCVPVAREVVDRQLRLVGAEGTDAVHRSMCQLTPLGPS